MKTWKWCSATRGEPSCPFTTAFTEPPGFATSWCATSRGPSTPPTAMPGSRGKSGCAWPPRARRHKPGHGHCQRLHGLHPPGDPYGTGPHQPNRYRFFQEVDITGITIPITKHNYLVKDPQKIPAVVKNAFHIAATGRPGPVLVDLPKDVMQTKIQFKYPSSVHLRGYKPTYKGFAGKIREIAQLIKKSQRPVIYGGGRDHERPCRGGTAAAG